MYFDLYVYSLQNVEYHHYFQGLKQELLEVEMLPLVAGHGR
jgi:hypothetical protein